VNECNTPASPMRTSSEFPYFSSPDAARRSETQPQTNLRSAAYVNGQDWHCGVSTRRSLLVRLSFSSCGKARVPCAAPRVANRPSRNVPGQSRSHRPVCLRLRHGRRRSTPLPFLARASPASVERCESEVPNARESVASPIQPRPIVASRHPGRRRFGPEQ